MGKILPNYNLPSILQYFSSTKITSWIIQIIYITKFVIINSHSSAKYSQQSRNKAQSTFCHKYMFLPDLNHQIMQHNAFIQATHHSSTKNSMGNSTDNNFTVESDSKL